MKKKETIKGGRKTIILQDADVLNMVNDIAKISEYEGNFNKIVNHALKFGIVTLYEKLFIDEETPSVDNIDKLKIEEIKKDPKDKQIEDYMDEIVKLSKENMVCLSIVKSIVSTLFNVKVKEASGEDVPCEKIKDGSFRRTPEYLESYEVRYFKNAREGN